jgi:hypothetical protein
MAKEATVACEPFSLERGMRYLDYFSSCSQKSCDYSLVNLWAWDEYFGYHWAWDGDLVWLLCTRPYEALQAPVGRWETQDWREIFERFQEGTCFERVPERLACIWKRALGDQLEVRDDRGQWEYIYRIKDLVELKGNRYHGKRNLLRQFMKNYDWTYSRLEDRHIPEVLKMQQEWCESRDAENSVGIAVEDVAIKRTFSRWRELPNLIGGVLYAGGKMVAYTVGERLDDETLLIHFEKGLSQYKGVYQAINYLFLLNEGAEFTWVNREQDLNIEGLRKAKMSYHPAFFLRKCRVKWLGVS